jgi:aminoglycoside phosphotransferase (APT) family kinase protein
MEAERRVWFEGSSLVHGDLWYANLCFADRGPVVVDWGSAMRGNPALDRATVAVDLLVAGRDTRPMRVPDLAAWVALLAGHQALEATRPLDPTVRAGATLRKDQAADAAALLPRLADLLGLPPVAHTRIA